MLLTHCPFVPTPDSEDWDPKDKDTLSYKGKPEYFPNMVSYMDKMVGKIVAKVDELSLSENTLIIFTGDNGTDQPIVSMLRGMEYPGGKRETLALDRLKNKEKGAYSLLTEALENYNNLRQD